MRERLEAALELVRQTLALHSGGIELVSCDEASGTVKVRFLGHCSACAMSAITLKHGVETALCRSVPEIRQIIAV